MKLWLQRLFGGKNRPIRCTNQRHAFRPQVECLEHRLVMSAAPAIVWSGPVYLPYGLVVTVTSSLDSGAGSLRAAIETINNDHLLRRSADEILFDNSGGVIFLDSSLPALTRGDVIINGTNEASTLPTELFGVPFTLFSNTPSAPVNGLTIDGGGTTVENMDLILCNNGIVLGGQGGDALQYDSFGVANASIARNVGYGVVVNNVGSNTITDCTFAANVLGGIEITGAAATFNTVSANQIGTGPTATTAPGVQQYGVLVEGGATNNTIIGNIISGNSVDGVYLVASGNVVQSNFIGTDFSGEHAVANGTGVGVAGNNNIISDNTISGNAGDGVALFGNDNTVQGNMIGTDDTGEVALPNGFYGVAISGSGNVVGGTAFADRNVISANSTHLSSALAANVFVNGWSNVIEGNFIGTDATGTRLLPSSTLAQSGPTYNVLIQGPCAKENVIGGTAAGAGNLISGAAVAIFISDQQGEQDDIPLVGQNQIQGNLIDTDVTGTVKLFSGTGIVLLDTIDNVIGGTTSGRNVIAVGAGDDGVEIEGSTGNEVLGNSIGVGLNGKTDLGAKNAIGILFSNAKGNTADDNTIGFCDVGIKGVTGNTHQNNTFVKDTVDTQP